MGDTPASGVSLAEACRNAGQKRFWPITMSTMTTVLGLLPLAISRNALFVPMARLLMGGLAASMCVNLILVPILFSLMNPKGMK
ncbi:MAG: efflux RND transporter permease subunit [Clostridium sp.]|nr:efflux RND transporter permease subunit [Clostridium sp.]